MYIYIYICTCRPGAGLTLPITQPLRSGPEMPVNSLCSSVAKNICVFALEALLDCRCMGSASCRSARQRPFRRSRNRSRKMSRNMSRKRLREHRPRRGPGRGEAGRQRTGMRIEGPSKCRATFESGGWASAGQSIGHSRQKH